MILISLDLNDSFHTINFSIPGYPSRFSYRKQSVKQILSEITANTQVGKNQYRVDFTVDWEASPISGQFVTLQCGNGNLLKRPFSIGWFTAGVCSVIYKVVGDATRALSFLKPGDSIKVLGPLGNGFPVDCGDLIPLYIGGGCGMPPLLFDSFLRMQTEGKVVFAGFRTGAETVLKDEFADTDTEYRIVTEDGSEGEKGLVTDILKKYLDSAKSRHIIYSSGPMPMLEKVAEIAENKGVKCYLCLESYMGCGFGVCNGCVHPIRNSDGSVSYKKVCTDGPVFDSQNVIWDKSWIAS